MRFLRISALAVAVIVMSTGVLSAQVYSSGPGLGLPISTTLPPTINDINVAGGPSNVTDLNVCINLTHTWDSDLDIFLQGPVGPAVELSTGNGGSGDNYLFTVFDDQSPVPITAGVAPFPHAYAPEGSLSQYNAGPADGLWQIQITDNFGGDDGILDYWSLGFNGAQDGSCNNNPPPPPPPPPPVFAGGFTGTPNSLALGVPTAGTTIWDDMNPFPGLTDGAGELAAGTRYASGNFDNLGNEVGYVLNHAGGDLIVDLTGLTTDLDLHLMTAGGTPADAIDTSEIGGTGDENVSLLAAPAGTYYVAVDGFGSANLGSTYSIVYTPEPGSLALLGLAGLALIRRRR